MSGIPDGKPDLRRSLSARDPPAREIARRPAVTRHGELVRRIARPEPSACGKIGSPIKRVAALRGIVDYLNGLGATSEQIRHIGFYYGQSSRTAVFSFATFTPIRTRCTAPATRMASACYCTRSGAIAAASS